MDLHRGGNSGQIQVVKVTVRVAAGTGGQSHQNQREEHTGVAQKIWADVWGE